MIEKRGSVARRAGSRLFWLAAALGCQSVDHPPPGGNVEAPKPEPGAAGDGGIALPEPGEDGGVAAPDGSVNCGGQRIEAVVDRPNLYFLIDGSGSMDDTISPASSTSKYTAARKAIGDVLRAMGHRVRYGAMIFPAASDGCDAGREIFPLTVGDPLGDRDPELNGPHLQVLLNRLAAYGPVGGTPTAVSLAAVRDLLADQPGRSTVVLATDGAPNCNPDLLSCPSDRCIPDIEGAVLKATPRTVCGVDVACCEKGVLANPGPTVCMDDESTEAEVAALAKASILTYVVGMPGSEAYAALLGRLAEAGRTARANEETKYYAVTDEDELTDALSEIGAGLTIGCEVTLDSIPDDPALVNLYFDRQLVPQDASDGWQWGDANVVNLRGDACKTLESGNISSVELVYGCRTVVR